MTFHRRLNHVVFYALAGAALLFSAWALVQWRDHVVTTTRWVALHAPLPAESGTKRLWGFQVERGGDYELGLEMDRPPAGPNRIEAECLLGFLPRGPEHTGNYFERQCPVATVVEFLWRIDANGRQIDRGLVSGVANVGSYSDVAVKRWVTTFDAQQGEQYSLYVETREESSALSRYQPRLTVAPTPRMSVEESFLSGVIRVAGVFLAVLGAGFLGFALLLLGRRLGSTSDSKSS